MTDRTLLQLAALVRDDYDGTLGGSADAVSTLSPPVGDSRYSSTQRHRFTQAASRLFTARIAGMA